MKHIAALLTVSLLFSSIPEGAAMAQLTSSAHSTASSFNSSVSYSGANLQAMALRAMD